MFPSFRAVCSNVNKLAKSCENRLNIYPSFLTSSNLHLNNSDERNFYSNILDHSLYKNNQYVSSSSSGLNFQSKRGLGSSIPSSIGKAVSKDERREFMAVFPDIVRDLTEYGKILDVPDVTKWYSRLLQYNVPGGKKNRGLSVVLGYKMFARPEDLTPENLRRVMIMGWCIEMLQAFFLVLDDMIDQSETRRGRLCWYKNPEVGLSAVNDGIFIESGIYQLIKKHFLDQPYYFDVLDLFHDTTHKTIMGQALDNLTALSIPKYKLDKFTMSRYNSIVKFKTSYYSFHLPIALAMYMANIRDPEKHRQAKTILLEMGNFFQVQDDYLDCFGHPDVIGKIGTDIQDGKCSWLAVVALQRCTKEQRSLMEECYGKPNPEQIARVKELYNQLSLPAMFSTYEEESYNLIVTHIQQMSGGLKHDLFFKLLDKIYQREN